MALKTLLCLLSLAALGAAFAPQAPGATRWSGAQMHPWGLGEGRDPADNLRELDALEAAGANTVRIDMPWADIEPFRDRIDPGFLRRVDEFMAAANRRGMDPIMTVAATPCWASSAPGRGDCSRFENRFRGFRYAPTDPAELGEISAFLARRYTSDPFRLAALEVWNEPNGCLLQLAGEPSGCAPTSGVDPASGAKAAVYAEMVRATYPRVKTAAPKLTVLAGALGGEHPLRFLRALYRRGLLGHYDAISIHPYNRRFEPGSDGSEDGRPAGQVFRRYVEAAHRTVAEAESGGRRSPIWLTELGWSACPLGDPPTAMFCVSEGAQARFLGQALETVERDWPWVEGVSVYEVRDSPVANPVEGSFGLLERDFGPKPSHAAFAGRNFVRRVAAAVAALGA